MPHRHPLLLRRRRPREHVGEPRPPPQGFAWLEDALGDDRGSGRTRPEGSYTARLLEGGVDAVARKVAEEATEVVLAAKDDQAAAREGAAPRDQAALAGEVADLLYHTLVLLAERGLDAARGHGGAAVRPRRHSFRAPGFGGARRRRERPSEGSWDDVARRAEEVRTVDGSRSRLLVGRSEP